MFPRSQIIAYLNFPKRFQRFESMIKPLINLKLTRNLLKINIRLGMLGIFSTFGVILRTSS